MHCLRNRKYGTSLMGKTNPRKRTRRPSVNDENTSPERSAVKQELPDSKKRCTRESPLKDIVNEEFTTIKVSPFETIKASLHNSVPPVLMGRGIEMTAINDFLTTHVTNHTPGSLYIAGPPGTGKTAAIMKCLSNPKFVSYKVININCMRLSSPSAVYSAIYQELVGTTKKIKKSEQEYALRKHLTTTSRIIILVLDEIDQLISSSQQVLYSILEWPSLKHSNLVLISIANSLDLTDRLLPRLQTNPKTRPLLLNFTPYTSEDITAIIEGRLDTTLSNVFDKMAVKFCARKVASVSGDIRKALDICRRAVELVEMEDREKECIGDNGRVTIKHVASVLEEVYGVSVSSTGDIGDVPLQQKLVACTVLLLTNKGIKEPTLGKLYETYVSVCSKKRLKQESNNEFVSLVNMLEAKGIVKLCPSKRSTLLSKVVLLLQEDELSYTLQDKTLISSVLQIIL